MTQTIVKIFKTIKNTSFIFLTLFFILFSVKIYAQNDWQIAESKHFKVIYKPSQSELVPLLLSSAENSLDSLMVIFNYKPTEKIIINTYDYSDFGYAATTTVPKDFIRLEIEPFETGYENIPFDERFQWLLSHELVHIVVDDKASGAERFFRSIFAKVAPEQSQPMTVLYSLLTNYSRYTPRWHQEGIAVFLETWFNGGFGRELGNFDEMFFRSKVLDKSEFPSPDELDAKTSLTSFMLGTLYYTYGARFCSYLAIKYGYKKLISWYSVQPGDFYEGYLNKFEEIYGISLKQGWRDFIKFEKEFQQQNIDKIESAPVTQLRYLTPKSIGWVTNPGYNPFDSTIIFGYHNPNHLAQIGKLNLIDLTLEKIGTLPTPSLIQVASTAYDASNGFLFYTTKNNELYRDLNVLQENTGNEKLLFENCRIGDLTVSPKTHELWGVIHSDAKTSLVYSSYPYHDLIPVIGFNVGDIVSGLSVSPDGHKMAAVLHRASGEQSLILTDCDSLKTGGAFKYETISTKGSPEFPSWSPDSKTLFWNAYVNGVSNIYRLNLYKNNSEAEALTNTPGGLFKPLYISSDSLFAFEFTPSGFKPVLFANKKAKYLPAINYEGQEIVNKNPQVTRLTLSQPDTAKYSLKKISNNEYNSLGHLNILTFVPVLSGFQNQKVLGIYTHISDPLIIHDFTLEMGVSPKTKNGSVPQFHIKAKYYYKREIELGVEYNAPDFYDLFNKRKRGMIGTHISLGQTYYWIYDNPLKVIQKSEISWYTGIKFLNDNLIKINIPDFFVAQTQFSAKSLRRSIGSIDFEDGNQFESTLLFFSSQDNKKDVAGQIYGGWDNYSTWLFNHNIFHLNISGGYSWKTERLVQGKFYFGGFGNRYVENVDANQYRKTFRFPGVPIYSLIANKFAKIMFEDVLPPVRFSDASIGQHYLSHFNLAFYSQGLWTEPFKGVKYVDLGGQINFVFRHWYNLESTFSAGIAKAWYNRGNSWEWFLSIKLLKN